MDINTKHNYNIRMSIGFYTKKEASAFNQWRNQQRFYNDCLNYFDTIYKPWNDHTLCYKQRYQQFLRYYAVYKKSKIAVEIRLNELVFHRNCLDRTMIIDEIKKTISLIYNFEDINTNYIEKISLYDKISYEKKFFDTNSVSHINHQTINESKKNDKQKEDIKNSVEETNKNIVEETNKNIVEETIFTKEKKKNVKKSFEKKNFNGAITKKTKNTITEEEKTNEVEKKTFEYAINSHLLEENKMIDEKKNEDNNQNDNDDNVQPDIDQLANYFNNYNYY